MLMLCLNFGAIDCITEQHMLKACQTVYTHLFLDLPHCRVITTLHLGSSSGHWAVVSCPAELSTAPKAGLHWGMMCMCCVLPVQVAGGDSGDPQLQGHPGRPPH
jgi:hypothetical protein